VATVAQPPCEPPPGAKIDEKLHPSATLTALDAVVRDHRMRVRKAGADVRGLQFGIIVEKALNGFALRKQAQDATTQGLPR
jgi:hypothetical protein